MKGIRNSIRARLLIWLISALFFVSGLMFLEMRESTKAAANEAYDRVLYGSALAILDRVLVIEGDIDVDIPYVALEMLTSTAQDRIFYQVKRQDGNFITGYEDIPEPNKDDFEAENADRPIFYDAQYNQEDIRIAQVSRYISTPNETTRIIVKVAETTQARSDLIQNMLTKAVIRQLTLILIAGLLLWAGISWGLRPLIRLREALQRRNPKDLHPITHKVPEEVQTLADGINDLMSRLAENISAMRRFTTNAAHQLRTPLAAIQTQTELALQAGNEKNLNTHLEHLRHSTAQSTRLIQQLLSLAQASPDETSVTFTEIDLVKLTQTVTSKLVPKALENGIDLGYEAEINHALIKGNEALLEEAARNILENAIFYCPAQSEVTLKIAQHERNLTIEVKDNGPGIEEKYLPTLFDRFERAGKTDGEGCGLGLPIVKEIVERHHGSISLESQPNLGTIVTISFPA